MKEEKLEELLSEFGVARLRSASAISLSGGERRRVELARALAASPDLFFLMNRSQVLTRLRLVKLKIILENCLKIRGWVF